MTQEQEAYRRLCHRVYRRDGWKCRCPGCKARSGLHAHHLVFRSQGGPDVEWNMITLCHLCHDAVHDRNLEITFVGMEHTTSVFGWKFLNGWTPRRSLL